MQLVGDTGDVQCQHPCGAPRATISRRCQPARQVHTVGAEVEQLIGIETCYGVGCPGRPGLNSQLVYAIWEDIGAGRLPGRRVAA